MQSPEDKHKLIPDPDTAPIVRRIFDLAAAGNGYKAIAYILTDDKIPIPSVYANQNRPESDWVKAENTHPPLVTQELWDLVHESVKRRRKVTKDKEPHIFSGLVRCADCGSILLKN